MLGAVGLGTGLAFAWVGQRLLGNVRWDLPISPTLELGLEWPVLLFAVSLAAATGVICGLVPALQAFRLNLVPALKSETSSSGPRGWRPSASTVLVVSQVAFSLVLLVAASLLARSTQAARSVDLGYEAESVGVITMDLGTLQLEREASRNRID